MADIFCRAAGYAWPSVLRNGNGHAERMATLQSIILQGRHDSVRVLVQTKAIICSVWQQSATLSWHRLVGASNPSSSGTPANQLRGHQLLGSSQFCLTLVVQPPNSTLIGFQPDSLRACWGVPCQGPLGPTNRMAAGSVLWILAMVDGAQQAKAAGEGFSLSAILTVCQPRSRLEQSRIHNIWFLHIRLGHIWWTGKAD